MVNYGISRACNTCKKRRKKCDETRPACYRCINSNRICPGYENESALIFRHYQPHECTRLPTFGWWMPKAVVILEESALGIFLDHFVVPSHDRLHSRGFLDGMQLLFTHVSRDSTLVSAARVIVLASIANRSKQTCLLVPTRKLYGQLLKDFTIALSQEIGGASIEQFLTAVLLGLFEIITSSHGSPAKYLVHVRGVSSILRNGVASSCPKLAIQLYSPGTSLILKNPLLQQAPGLGVFCPPLNDQHRRSLDLIIVKMSPLTDRVERLFFKPFPPAGELFRLREDLLALDDDIIHWFKDLPGRWIPKVLGHIEKDIDSKNCCYRCPGPVEHYFDLYVATVVNCWRSIYIIYIDQLVRIDKALGQGGMVTSYLHIVRDLVAALKASVPFFLSESLECYLQHARAGTVAPHSQRVAGGLLLLHPLYAVAKCTVVPLSDRIYLVNILRWIGTEMGISQAKILADYLQSDIEGLITTRNPEIPFIDVLEGHFLISASMMLEPSTLARWKD